MFWDFKGVFPSDVLSRTSPFWGFRGIEPKTGGSYAPSGVVSADKTEVVAPGQVNLTCVAVNTTSYMWEESMNGTSWTVLSGEVSKEYHHHYPLESGVVGDHYYRAVCIGPYGSARTEPVKITVTPHAPEISVSTPTPSVSAPCLIQLIGTSQYATSYQWQVSSDGETFADMAGKTTLRTLIEVLVPGDVWYRCIASGVGGTATSEPVKVEVSEGHGILVRTDFDIIEVGESAELTAVTDHIDNIEWQSSLDGIVWVAIPGESGQTYTFTPTSSGVYYFRAVGSYTGGSVTSNEVMIEVE